MNSQYTKSVNPKHMVTIWLKVAQQGLDLSREVSLRVLLAQVGACQELDVFAGLQRLIADAESAFIEVPVTGYGADQARPSSLKITSSGTSCASAFSQGKKPCEYARPTVTGRGCRLARVRS